MAADPPESPPDDKASNKTLIGHEAPEIDPGKPRAPAPITAPTPNPSRPIPRLRPPRIAATSLGIDPPILPRVSEAPISERPASVPPATPSPRPDDQRKELPKPKPPPLPPRDTKAPPPLPGNSGKPLPFSRTPTGSHPVVSDAEAPQSVSQTKPGPPPIRESARPDKPSTTPLPGELRVAPLEPSTTEDDLTTVAVAQRLRSATTYSMTAERERKRERGDSRSEPPEPLASQPPPSAPRSAPPAADTTIDADLVARVAQLRSDDPVGAARACLELGLVYEWIKHDRDAAQVHYEEARKLVRTLQPALARIRRLISTGNEKSRALDVLTDELLVAETDDIRADLLASRGRLYEWMTQLQPARDAYAQALKFRHDHPAALRGLESVLRRQAVDNATAQADLATHLLTVAEIYAPKSGEGDPALGAWIFVERADLLERAPAQHERAREALERGVALEPSPGPVRARFVQHLARYDRDTGFAQALQIEAEREADNARASRLLYTAARIALDRLGSRGDTLRLLSGADSRAPQGSPTQHRILDELVTQHEADGNFHAVADTRTKRLSLITAREALAHEYIRLAEAYSRMGRADLAADMAARSLHHDPTSVATREKLDQALQRLGRHADRVRAWVLEANSDRPIPSRVSAYRKAADISVRHLSQKEQAIETLRAAWLLQPGNGAVFDDLAALLRPPPVTDETIQQNVLARVDLYHQAVSVETDRDRKIGLLDKVLAIHEDELGNPKAALEVADEILAIEPGRRAAILSLARNARRAGDMERLSHALSEEAKITQDAALRCRLWLDAAEATERLGDRERALGLIERALTSRPNDKAALRAKVALLGRMSRHDEARKTLVLLAKSHPNDAFETNLEIAEVDEALRKSPLDAVDAYVEAARLKPDHPLPRIGVVRLLRATKNWAKLVETLENLAKSEQDQLTLGRLYAAMAETQEFCLNDDTTALASYDKADEAWKTALSTEESLGYDPLMLEGMERIYSRQGSDEGLTRLYARWLERKPVANIDHALRVALSRVLSRTSPQQAVEVLEALVGVVPNHVPALRMLEHLHREKNSHASLANMLYSESSVFKSKHARAGALWELVTMEERVGPSMTLDALSRIITEFPTDCGALDTVIRVASRIVAGVGVPHPALVATRTLLLSALRARRDLALDPVAKASFFLEEAILHEASESDARAALDGYREALELWTDSFIAARGLDRMGTKLGDAAAVIKAQLALAKLVRHPVTRAAHYARAAELLLSHQRDERQALELFEVALQTDPESGVAAGALSKMLKADPRRLVERLRPALERARAHDQIALLGVQIGSAMLEMGELHDGALDYGLGIKALRQVLGVRPDDIGTLFLLARLYQAQKAWAEARDTLIRVIEVAPDAKARVAAHFALADVYEGPLADSDLAEATLTKILSFDSRNKAALERLYNLALRKKDTALVRSSLERLAENEPDLHARTEYQLRLAEVCRENGDSSAMVRALADAAVSTPTDLRAWNLLSRSYRTETAEGAQAFVSVVEQILELAKARRQTLDARWLLTIGLLEVNVLKRAASGVAHLQQAASMGSLPEVRAALGQGLLAAGRNKEAVVVLRELLAVDADHLVRLAEAGTLSTVRGATVAGSGTVLSASLACLDAALATEGRAEERLAVEEVRACLGDVAIDRVKALRARRLEPEAPYANGLAASELQRNLLPEARSPIIDVAIAIQPIAAKALRFELSSLGVGSRDRIGPRDGHPTRVLADRIARCLGITEFELYLSSSWQGALRAYPGDPPALVGGASFVELPEPEQVFALSRLFVRIALGMTWLDEIPIDVADGLLLSSIRSVLPQFASGDLSPQREHSAQNLSQGVQRAMGRRQRRSLEELAPALTAAYDFRAISIAIRRSEYRVGYLMTGDLLSSVDYLRRTDSDIARSHDNPRVLLQHPVTNELMRFALTAESHSERRRLGTVWMSA